MIEYFRLPSASLNKHTIPIQELKKRFAKRNNELYFLDVIKRITWNASIREKETGIKGYEDTNHKCEEIEIITADLSSDLYTMEISSFITYHIPYLCILLIKYKSKYKIILCKANKYKHLKDRLDVKSFMQTFWIYPEKPSLFQNIISNLDIPGYKAKDLFSLYIEIYYNMSKYKQLYITKNQLSIFCDEILNKKFLRFLIANCEKRSFKKQNIEFYDIGDIWYLLNINAEAKELIHGNCIIQLDDFIEVFNQIRVDQRGDIFNTKPDYDKYEEEKSGSFDYDVNDYDSEDYSNLFDLHEEEN